MQTVKESFRDIKPQTGFFHSSNVPLPPEEVFNLCCNLSNVKQLVSELPKSIQLALFSAEQLSSNEFEIKWESLEDSSVEGCLTIFLTRDERTQGTIMVAEAVFEPIHSADEEPSVLMSEFLKKMQTLLH